MDERERDEEGELTNVSVSASMELCSVLCSLAAILAAAIV